jgi:hypothetical protein
MAQSNKITLYALDCGTVNWRLYRMEYHFDGSRAQHVTSPLSSPLTNFSDRKLPAVITLTEDGTDIGAIGETALGNLEDALVRNRIREFFKPSIGSHLIEKPSPHQERFSHFEALLFTRLLLKALIDQIQTEKYASEPFDERFHFSIAYPDYWRTQFDGKVFEDFYHVILECFPSEISEQVHFVPESEGVILGLRDQSLLERFDSSEINLIIDVGGSTTTLYARRYNAETDTLVDVNHYQEPFGGGLYDALLAKFLSDELDVPSNELSQDPSAFMALRIWGQLIKESLSRVAAGGEGTEEDLSDQQVITLVMNNDQVYRKNLSLPIDEFIQLTKPLDTAFQEVVTRGMEAMQIKEESVGRVLLLGGGVNMPGILDGIKSRFGDEKLIFPNNPEEIIVRGIGLAFTGAIPERESKERMHLPTKKSRWELVHKDGKVIPLTKEITIAGRSKESDIQLDSKKCSRTHALIRLEGEALTLIDLRSKNGTFVNNTQLEPNAGHYLNDGDQVRFGDQLFVLK